MGEPPKSDWLVSGAKLTVAYATAGNGTQPAREFLASPEVVPRLARLKVLMQRLTSEGRIANREQFKKVRGHIWEFKAHQVRLLCFQMGPFWMLTNGCIKKQDNLPVSEIEKAERIRSEVLNP